MSGEIQKIPYIASRKTKGFLLVIFGHCFASRYYAYYVLPLLSGKYSFPGSFYLIALGIMTKSIRLRYFHKSEKVKISQLVQIKKIHAKYSNSLLSCFSLLLNLLIT